MCACNISYPACNAHAPYYVVICGLSGSTIFFFSHYVTISEIFEKKMSDIRCVLIFPTELFETFLVLRRIQRDIIQHVQGSSSEVLLFLPDFHKTYTPSTDFRKPPQISNIIKTRPVGAVFLPEARWLGGWMDNWQCYEPAVRNFCERV